MVIGIDASRANQREKTGTEWYSWHLIRALAPRLKKHRLRLYTREPLEPGLSHLGDQVEARVLTWPIGVMWSHLRLSWELLIHPPDVLFVPADTVPLIRRCPTVTTIHDIAFERFPELYAGRSVQRRLGWLRPFIHLLVRVMTLGRYSASERDYHRWSVRHALRVSRRILTVSEFTKKEMVELLGADPSQIVVTYQGVMQPEDFVSIDETAKNEARRKYQLNRPYFLFIGRLESKKNIRSIIEGYLHYRQVSSHPFDLILIGSPGYGWSEVAELAAAQRDCIHQLGWMAPVGLKTILSAARGFIFISQYEGFGIPPLEAFSAGVPVIASHLASIPEVVGDQAIYVDPKFPNQVGQAMLRIEQDRGLVTRLIAGGYQQVRKFTWDKTAEKTIEVLIK